LKPTPTHSASRPWPLKAAFTLWAALWMTVAAGTAASASTPSTVETRYPGLASGLLKSARVLELPSAVLLKTDGFEIRAADLDRMVQNATPELKPQLQKNLFFLLEQEAGRRVIVREAQAAGVAGGLSEDQAVQRFFRHVSENASVSETEVRAFYDANKEMVGGAPFDQVSGAIRQLLLQNKQEEAVQNYIAALQKRLVVYVNGEWVKSQYALARDNPVDKARTSGRPTLIEFGASGCVPCDMMQPILDKLRKTYAERLNVVFVHVGEEKILAARFGIRAIPVQVFFDRQGKEMFRHEGFFAEPEVNKVLAKMGVQ
jgi:thiol-disulfide isomerase/thioredoxin